MSDKANDVDLTRAKQNTGVWLVKVRLGFSVFKFHFARLFIAVLVTV